MASAASKVLIYGVAGVGGVLARRLTAAGRAVHVFGRDAQKLAALQASLAAPASQLLTTSVLDVMDAPAVEAETAAVVGRSAEAGAPVGGLAYAVGSIPLKPLRSTTAADFLTTFQLNTLGAMLAVKAAAPALTAGGAAAPGSVVLFSTVAAQQGFPNHTAIAAAKGALQGFVLAAGAELAPRCRVNAIALSLTDTPLASRLTGAGETVRKALGEAHPMGRLGSAEEAAGLAAFLLDNGSSGWMTGQTLGLDGGRSTLRPKN